MSNLEKHATEQCAEAERNPKTMREGGFYNGQYAKQNCDDGYICKKDHAVSPIKPTILAKLLN